jgi:hypothetical protein
MFNTSLFAGGIKKLLPNLFNFGKVIVRFLGPVGLAVTAVSLLYIGVNKYKAAQEKARLAVEGLGEAANISGNKLKNLDEYFGITPTKSPFETAGTNNPTTPEKTTAVQQLRENETFQKDFKNDIEALRTASEQEAGVVLNAMAMKLAGRGYSKDQIDTILRALQQEAGKTDLELEFKNLDLKTKGGKAGFKKNVKETIDLLTDAFNDGIVKKKKLSMVPVGDTGLFKTVETTVNAFSNDLKKNISTVSQSITSMITGLSGQLANGQISAEEFAGSFAEISTAIQSMPEPQALYLMDVLMRSLPENLRNTARGINDTKYQLMLLEAQALGMANLPGLIEAMDMAANGFGPDQALAKIRIENARKEMDKRTKLYEDFAKVNKDIITDGATDGLSAESQKYIKLLEQEIKELEKKRDAQKAVNEELQRQLDLQMKQQDLANRMKQAQISGDYLGAALLGQEQRKNVLDFNQETAALKLDALLTKLNDRLANIKDGAKLTKAEKTKIVKKAAGGYIQGFEPGGKVSGPGTATSDSIPAMLSDGEYVVKSAAVSQYGVPLLHAINSQKFATGGMVSNGATPHAAGMQWGGQGKLNSYQKFMLGIARNSGFVDKAFGIDSIFRSLAGKSNGKGDAALAAMAPLQGLGGAAKLGGNAVARMSAGFSAEMKSFEMADIDAKAMNALSKMDLSSISIPKNGISFNPEAATSALSALKNGKQSSGVWEIIQAQRESLLKSKYPKVDLSDVTKFNEHYAKEFYGLLPDDAIKLFKGVRSTSGSAWRTGKDQLETYFSTNPHTAALYSALIGSAKIGEELPMFSTNKKIKELINFLGEGAIRPGNAQGSMEFPQLLNGSMLSESLPSIYSLPGQVYGQMFGATGNSLNKIKNIWPSGFKNGGIVQKFGEGSGDKAVSKSWWDKLGEGMSKTQNGSMGFGIMDMVKSLGAVALDSLSNGVFGARKKDINSAAETTLVGPIARALGNNSIESPFASMLGATGQKNMDYLSLATSFMPQSRIVGTVGKSAGIEAAQKAAIRQQILSENNLLTTISEKEIARLVDLEVARQAGKKVADKSLGIKIGADLAPMASAKFSKVLHLDDLNLLNVLGQGKTGINQTQTALIRKTGEYGYAKSLNEVTIDEVKREVFGPKFAKMLGLIAPENTPFRTAEDISSIHSYGVFSKDLGEASIIEKNWIPKLHEGLKPHLQPTEIYGNDFEKLGMVQQKAHRDVMMAAMGYVDTHSKNLIINPELKKLGMIDYGRMGESRSSLGIFDVKNSSSAYSRLNSGFTGLSDSGKNEYLKGILQAQKTLKDLNTKDLQPLLQESGYLDSEIPGLLDLYGLYKKNTIDAIDRFHLDNLQYSQFNIPFDDVTKNRILPHNPGQMSKGFFDTSAATGGYLTKGMLKLPKFHDWNGPVPGTYGQELPAVLKSGTEGVYQEGYINDLKNAASNTTNSASSVYNVNMSISSPSANPKEVATEVMRQLQVATNKNNKMNVGLK